MRALRRTICAIVFVGSLALAPSASGARARYRVVVIPKLTGIEYYAVVKKGVDQAAAELPDVQVVWTGPTQDLVAKQIDLIEKLIPTRPDLIAVAANDPVAIAPVLRSAREAGIRVMSWDGDAAVREFFVNLVDFDDFGAKLVEALAEEVGAEGEIVVVTTSFSAPNQTSWIAAIKRALYARHRGLRIVDIQAAGESTEESYRITRDLLGSYPGLKGIVALGVPNVPGVARAVEDAGLAGKVAVVGNSTPNLMRPFLKHGTVRKVLLWNAPDHGYLTVYAAYRLLTGGLQPGVAFQAGRLGSFTPRKDDVSMQIALPVMIFTRENVDQHHF